LRDALDIFRSRKITDLTLTMTKLQSLGISPLETLIGLGLTGAGFILYYLVPYAFLFRNTSLFFFLVFTILFGLIIGLIYLTHFAVAYLQSPILGIYLRAASLLGYHRAEST
jgi:hypothetical protein